MARSAFYCLLRVIVDCSAQLQRFTFRLSFLPFVLVCSPVFCRAQVPQSDPTAVALANQAMSALTSGVSLSDITLSGNVNWTNGSDSEAGTGTFLALGTGESRMDLVLSTGTRTEIRDASSGYPQGKWVSPSGASGRYAYHNCFTDPVWFFPALGSLAMGPNVVLSFIGQETRNDQQVSHIQSYIYQDSQSGVDGQLSTMDFYLDTTTFLPVAAMFNVHPDNNPASNMLVEVDFSNYQAVSGVAIPSHVQKYVQGGLSVDFTVSSASVNNGVSISQFQIN